MANKKKDIEEENKSSESLIEETVNEETTVEEKATEPTNEEKLALELMAMNDKYLRLAAEYDNFRKRSQREKEAIYPEAIAATAGKILPLADSFERAMNAPCSDPDFKKGMDMITLSLNDIFTNIGIESFGDAGDVFDPNMHNAVMHVEEENIEVSTVVEVFQKGYKIGDRVLRYAMVKVAN